MSFYLNYLARLELGIFCNKNNENKPNSNK